MAWGLRLLAAASAIAALIALGLSAMASDDMGRAREAHQVQLLALAWLLLSVATPFAAAAIGAQRPGTQALFYAPMLAIALLAITRLAGF